MNITKTLAEFGLNDKEIKVYLACLELGESSPFQISKMTEIPRTTVYDTLLNLSLKGLIELKQSDGFEKQQTKIKVKNPFVLRTILQEKRQRLFELESDIIQILPNLKERFLQNTLNPEFMFFPGIDGFKKVYLEENDLNESEIYVFDNLQPMDVLSEKEINDDVNKSLKSSKNNSKELILLNDWTKHVISYHYSKDKKYLKNREIRYIENKSFDIKCRIVIAGNHVRVSCAYEDEVWGAIVDSKGLSITIKSIFLQIWSSARELREDMVKSWGDDEFYNVEKKRSLLKKTKTS